MKLEQVNQWDIETDILVVGFGAAGGVAAIEAADTGCSVVILEKMAFPGGISAISAGGVRVCDDPAKAFAYLQATCGGRTPDDVLHVLADGMAEIADYLRGLAPVSDATVAVTMDVGNYPLPGFEALAYCEITNLPALENGERYYATDGVRNGARLFKLLEDNVAARGIAVHYETPACSLITDGNGNVCGLVAEKANSPVYIRANKAVILTCGGFESDAEMQAQYLQASPVVMGSFAGNTGDGIRMAQAVGADLWHMWHYHGPYGMRDPKGEYPFAFYLKNLPMWTSGYTRRISKLGIPARPGQGNEMKKLPPMAWILLDQAGRRFMDEYPPYPGDTGVRPFDHFDPHTHSFTRNPAFVLFDEAGRKMYPMGSVAYNDADAGYLWSKDNLKEVERGVFTKADSIAALAKMMDVDELQLTETVARWNSLVEAGEDIDFGRHADTMVPLKEPPFYFGYVHPVVINTQGGPRHNVKQEVVDPFGAPIPRLYAAGELGSVFGHLYLAGGNLSECIVGGRVAGQEAAQQEPWKAA